MAPDPQKCQPLTQSLGLACYSGIMTEILKHLSGEGGPSPYEGKLLLATPGINDGSYFDKSLIYICAHSDEGAIGIIVNQPMPMVEFDDLTENIGVEKSDIIKRPHIYFGGPVDTERGFVLHSTEYTGAHSIKLSEQLALNASIDILKNMALGQGPKHAIFALGYAGWGPGQLDEEVEKNFWLTLDVKDHILFQAKAHDKWSMAMHEIGVTPEHLSASAGRA